MGGDRARDFFSINFCELKLCKKATEEAEEEEHLKLHKLRNLSRQEEEEV